MLDGVAKMYSFEVFCLKKLNMKAMKLDFLQNIYQIGKNKDVIYN